MRQLNGRYTQAFNRRHQRVGHLFQGRFAAILVDKDTHLLELFRYVVLNPVRAKMVTHPRLWSWSSYRRTAGERSGPAWLTAGWILSQFGMRQREAQQRYRQCVTEGRGGPGPWEQVQGRIYPGSIAFIAQHQPDRVIPEISRRQTQAKRPALGEIFQQRGEVPTLIAVAYRQYGYRLHDIALHLGVHYATVSRRLKQAEQEQV